MKSDDQQSKQLDGGHRIEYESISNNIFNDPMDSKRTKKAVGTRARGA
jgi:hypothetical protein